MRNVALLEISTRLRLPAIAWPRISSEIPFEYTSAVSKKFTPASRQMSTRRVASATSELPQALKNSVPPPNVPVPKERTGTSKPDEPNCLYSIGLYADEIMAGTRIGGKPPAALSQSTHTNAY